MFNENDTELCGCITVTDDPIFEDDEFFNVNLACAVPGVIFGMMRTATIVILDNDGKFEDILVTGDNIICLYPLP